MFDEELLKKNKVLEKEWEERFSAMLEGKPLKKHTNSSDIELKSLYTPDDIKDIDYNDISLPGLYPFTRGHHPIQYRANPLIMSHGFGFGTGEETTERREFFKKMGSAFRTGESGGEDTAVYVLLTDLPTQRGYDPDEPQSRGKVGEGGLSISTVDDFEVLFKGISDVDKVLTIPIAFDSILSTLALWAVYMEDRRKEPVDKMFSLSCNLFNHQWWSDSGAFPPQACMRLSTEYIKWHLENAPLSFPLMLDGFNPHTAGANPVQEIAFDIAHVTAAIEECVKAGMDPDDVASRCWSHPGFSLDFFEDIAKLRAMRRLWAKVMKERLNCKRDDSLKFNTYIAQTHGMELTAQEPLNNIIRITTMAISAMLAGVDGLWVAAYDEALCIPTEEAAKIVVRTYQILSMETDIPHVTDPLGGSYYVEWLTDKLFRESEKVLKKIEELGGYYKCWESGWMKGELQENANRRFRQFKSGEKVKVGTTIYQTENFPSCEVFRVSSESEKRAVENVRRYRERRDNAKAEAAMSDLREACRRIDQEWPDSCGCLLEAMIGGARAGLTLGEMNGILREVFNWGFYAD